ncbi:MAG: sugar ABC transporter permease [Shimia sp.]|nr:sugar ABC transporter permease [Shimia sp.]MCP4823041.1 sugar ABC transporter permease [Shimia sp.]
MPATLLILAIYIIPILFVFLGSLTDYTLVSDYYEFVGFENYRQMFGDEVFANALNNTFFYALLFLPGAFIISLVLAIAIQEQKQFRSVLEVLYFLPVTSTLAAMALVWAALMDSGQGVINNTLQTFGLPRVNWFGNEDVVLYSLAIISLWSIIGFNMVLFLAGLTSIPKNLYEAAAMDGADHPVDKFFRVTWPMLGPTAMFVAVTSSITAFKLFDTVAILTQGGPDRASEVFLYLAFLEGFEYFNMGYSAALSLFFLGIIFLFALIQAFFSDRNVHY